VRDIVREHVVRRYRPYRTCSPRCASVITRSAPGVNPEDALGLLLLELTSLGDDLRAQRLGASKQPAASPRDGEIDVAIFAFDAAHALRLVNRSGAALLGRAPEQLLAATGESRSRGLSRGRRTARRHAHVSGRAGLGSCTRHVSARAAAPAAGAHRREPRAQRRGATGVEAADSCAQHELNNSLRRSSPSPTACLPHHREPAHPQRETFARDSA